MQGNVLEDARFTDLETGTVAKGSSSGTYSVLALNNNVEYDNAQCSVLCCIEEFKVRLALTNGPYLIGRP